MKGKFIFWYILSAAITFVILVLAKGYFEWDNLIVPLGGLIGVGVASIKSKSS